MLTWVEHEERFLTSGPIPSSHSILQTSTLQTNTDTFANSADPDKMAHIEPFLQI